MNRIKYETYHGAAGYDAVARKKIKELEKKIGSGGAEMVEKVLLEQADANFKANTSSPGWISENLQVASLALIPGRSYNVEIGGELYQGIAKEAVFMGAPMQFVGNASAITNPESGEPLADDTGESFFVVAMSMDGVTMVSLAIVQPDDYDGSTGYTCSVKISTMEEKASGGGGVMRVNFTFTDDGQMVTDTPYTEIMQAYMSGKHVFADASGITLQMNRCMGNDGCTFTALGFESYPFNGLLTMFVINCYPDGTTYFKQVYFEGREDIFGEGN